MSVLVKDIPTAPGRIPLIGHVLSLARRPLDFLDSIGNLGDIVRVYLGPRPAYYLTSPQLVHQLLVEQVAKFDKGKLFERAQAILGNGLATANGDFHLSQRRLIQPAFRPRDMGRYVDVIREQAQRKADSWRHGQVMVFNHEMHELALNIISLILFSRNITGPDFANVRRTTPVMVRGFMVRTLYPTTQLERIPIPLNTRFDEAIDTIHDIIYRYIAEARDRDAEGEDLLSLLLNARHPDTGLGMSDDQVRDEVVTMLVAGSETTALQTSWLFHDLSTRPDVAGQVYAELAEVLGGRPIEFEDVPKLGYLNRVIMECIRVHTPTWLLMRRSTAPVTLGETEFPAGTEILFSPTTLHRDKRLYPHPDQFDPDRWLPERVAERDRASFIPFGNGRRKCIGDSLALLQIAVSAATMLSQWRLLPAGGKKVGEYTLAAAIQPTNLRLRARRLSKSLTEE